MGEVVSKSKFIIKNYLFDNDKIYNVEDVVNNFADYFGISFNEMVWMYSNSSIRKKEEIIEYVYSELDKMYEKNIGIYDKEEVVNKRINDYLFYRERLSILAHKGNNYLSILNYVSKTESILSEDDFYEKVLNNLEVFHFSKGMTGKHLNKIMIALYHIMNEYKFNLNEINNLEKYNNQRFDRFNESFNEYEITSTDCLILVDDRVLDKTSLRKVYRR